MSDKAKCKSCGKKFSDHKGLMQTCAALYLAMKTLEQISTLPRGGRAKRLAVSTLRLLETT